MTLQSKVVVLLSGGQDSTTALFWAKTRLPGVAELHALSCLYGQRHVEELEAAKQIAMMAGCHTHTTVNLHQLFWGSESALIHRGRHDIPELKPDGGMRDHQMPQGLPTSFVPGRNLLFLAAAVARAGAIGADHIVIGVCQTDYSGYPDCRSGFIASMQNTVNLAWPSMHPAPIIHIPLMDRTKAETVKLAQELPGCMEALARSVTCYRGEQPGCGRCAACELRAKGFAEAGVVDPAGGVRS